MGSSDESPTDKKGQEKIELENTPSETIDQLEKKEPIPLKKDCNKCDKDSSSGENVAIIIGIVAFFCILMVCASIFGKGGSGSGGSSWSGGGGGGDGGDCGGGGDGGCGGGDGGGC